MPVPTDEPTPSPPQELAPGLTREGVENATVLAAAHDVTLRNTAFTVQQEYRAVFKNGTLYRHDVRTVRVAKNDRYYATGRTNVTVSEHRELRSLSWATWSNGTVTLSKYGSENTTTYRRISTRARRAQELRRMYTETNEEYIRDVLSGTGVETYVIGSVTRNGTTLYRVRVFNPTPPRPPVAFALQPPSNTTSYVSIDSQGVVHSLETNYTTETMDVSYSIRYTDIGVTTVTQPPWYDQAINETVTKPKIDKYRPGVK